MKQDFILAKEELSRIGILRIATDFYTEPKRKGAVYFVKSPATHDRTASLALYPNSGRFTDFANGNYSGDIIGFVAYIRGCNNWQALKELRGFYGLSDAREQDRQEVRRRIQLQQEKERKRKERQQAFYRALWSEIDNLKHWARIYRAAIETGLFEPFTDLWAHCIEQRQYAEYQLDILTGADCRTYRCMKYHGDYNTWLLDVLGVLEDTGRFKATPDELREIRKGGMGIGW